MYINTFKYTPKDVSCQLCTESVSYTHLDVYKRQDHGRAGRQRAGRNDRAAVGREL